MSEQEDPSMQMMAEMMRLGLDFSEFPNFSIEMDDTNEFLEHLRSLQPGASWRDVWPQLPEHWDMNDSSTWTLPPINDPQ